MSAHADGRARPTGYPLILDLEGRTVLLIGGGRVAARKAGPILESGARLRVVSPELGIELRRRHEAGEVDWEARPATPDDVAGAVLVVCASSDRRTNAAVAARAREALVPVVVADDAALGTASVPASIRRGPLVVAVTSGGTSPSLSAFLRHRLEAELGPEFTELAELAARMRRSARAAGTGPADREREAADLLPRLLELLREGRRDEAVLLVERSAPAPAPDAAPPQSLTTATEAVRWS